ncbi:hypothetical protein HHK36_029110 [Tetracentron sinense]|uniref:Zinc-ribbon domain-containing protein n=1 Tax=Tetracentron sinense TaxID=13715 RepID=A0A834YH09_TETSI|nr:hypothetical protein HHK36_029110 [Tetracentron sinense]
MAEVAKVRVVRCPKCKNLLPELPNFTVYQCGGCGAVLRAKTKTPETDGSSEKSDEERVRGGSKELESLSEKGGVNLSDASETEGVGRGRRRERVLPKRLPNSNSSSLSRTENREINGGKGVGTMDSRYDLSRVEKEVEYGGVNRHSSKAPVGNLDLGNDHDMNMNRTELTKANMDRDLREITPQIGNASESRRSGKILDWRIKERNGMAEVRRMPRVVPEDVRFSTSPYPDEGPSSYHLDSSYGYGQSIKKHNNQDGHNTVEYLEQDRAELLRKLDELKDQLSRSCDVADKPKERVPLYRRMVPREHYGGRDTWFPERSSRLNRVSMQTFAPNEHLRRPPYINDSHEAAPLMNRHDMDMRNFYHGPIHAPNEIPGYGDPFGPQMPMRAYHQPPHQYPKQPSHDLSGQYMDINPDPLASYPQNTFFHQPTCSCSHCYNKHWQVPAQVPPANFYNRRFPDAPANPMFYPLENQGGTDLRGYNPRGLNPRFNSREPQPHTRTHNLDSGIGGLNQSHPQRVMPANRNRRHCRPVAGGAPFMTCYNCFELLKLPRKLRLTEKNQQKLQCGACSTVISLLFENKRLVVSVPALAKQNPPEVDDGSGEVVNEHLLQFHGYANQGSMHSQSEDYDNSGYNFPSTDTKPFLSSKDQRVNLSESEKMEGLLSSSSSTSEYEQSLNSVIVGRVVSNSAELPLKTNMSTPLPGSPLREHFDYSSNPAVSRFEKGSRSKRSDQEKMIPNKSISRQNSVKVTSVATEMDVSFNEYKNTGLSQDSREVSKEEDRPSILKGGVLFAGFIKRSFRDFSRSNQTVENGRLNVSINGQPIPDHLVKKAEKKAGEILPGRYWYDYQAGFWGVMGQPCLGIVPPFIEEFNYPMPKNCAAGNTGVFVNGRELYQKDLDLLASRGLPTTRDKSYIVEISGRVRDEDSGEVLDSLGKLAPT